MLTKLDVLCDLAPVPAWRIAADAGISPSLLTFYRRGDRTPKLANLNRLGAILDYDPQRLLEEADEAFLLERA